MNDEKIYIYNHMEFKKTGRSATRVATDTLITAFGFNKDEQTTETIIELKALYPNEGMIKWAHEEDLYELCDE